jgi:DNA-binding NtrC family response regulator
MADGGTLFLDEIANLTLSQQARLLRVLQSGELERVGDSRTRKVDVRVLAATNADLRAEVGAGRFREDLLFRLNTIEIHLPALHQRPEDIAPLAQYFLERYSAKYRSAARGFSPAALSILATAPWPGNVRELDHAIERATLLAHGRLIDAPDLGRVDEGVEAVTPDRARTLDEVERDTIRAALAAHGGNVVQAARALGLSRSALYRRLERYGL